MGYFSGLAIALFVSLSSTFFGFDRDRAFYPAIVIVIAAYYALFAAMAGPGETLLMESMAIAVFYGLAVLGFKRNLWLVVGALFAHGVFDWFHGALINNAGVPVWWPAFCLACDLVLAAYLAWLLVKSGLQARVETSAR